MGPSRSCWNGTTSALQPEEITSKSFMCVLSINVLILKKSGNLYEDPRAPIMNGLLRSVFHLKNKGSFITCFWLFFFINYCRLFNTKSSLYIYIKYISFDLVGFYGISTIVDYLMPNPLYTYISNIYDLVWLGFMAYQLL